MSRSRKKPPIASITTAKSTKGYKKQRASTERAKQRNLLIKAKLKPDVELAHELEPWDEWQCERDGKWYFDPAIWPKLMRK